MKRAFTIAATLGVTLLVGGVADRRIGRPFSRERAPGGHYRGRWPSRVSRTVADRLPQGRQDVLRGVPRPSSDKASNAWMGS